MCLFLVSFRLTAKVSFSFCGGVGELEFILKPENQGLAKIPSLESYGLERARLKQIEPAYRLPV